MKFFGLSLSFFLSFVIFVCFALGFLSLGASQVRAERSLQQVFDDYFGPGIIDTTGETGRMTFPAGKYEITLIAKESGATFAPNGWYPLSAPSQLNQIFPGGTTPLTTVEVDIPTDYGLWIQTIFGLWKSQPTLNFDGVDHFRVFNIPGGGYAVGIEDLAGGGDWDFQDHVLAFVMKQKVPYFSQLDPQWGSQEYDHGNSLNLWCGSSLAQCGCAVTSAAMILKYYGVDKSPDGFSTNPATLNNWLKSRADGFIFGDTNFQAVADYAEEANKIYGTPKIDYLGRINHQNFSILDSDLNLDRPVILQEPGHFIVATSKSGSTYTINDPLSEDNTTLESYGGSFLGMRRYSLTNTNLSAILLSIPSPGGILIIDSEGRRLGQDPETGQIFNDIPNGNYYLQESLVDDTLENPPIPSEGSGNYYIEILDPQEDTYTIRVAGENSNAIFLGYDQNADVSSVSFNIEGLEQFKLGYSPEPGSQIQVSQIVDTDIKPGSEPNSINLKSNGIIPVAILTTPSFDATQVDVTTVKFGPDQAQETHGKGHLEDIDSDGDLDLVLHFKTQETGIENGDTQVCLTGATLEGTSIEGCDLVRMN